VQRNLQTAHVTPTWTAKLPSNDEEDTLLAAAVRIDVRGKLRSGPDESSETTGETTSDGGGVKRKLEPRKSKALKLKQRRSTRRKKLYEMDHRELVAKGSSLLAEAVLTPIVRKRYADYLRQLQRFVEQDSGIDHIPVETPEKLDRTIAGFFNQLYLNGELPHVGENILAAVMDKYPSYGKYGNLRVPASWRALRGWRRLSPAKSRKPYPAPLWRSIAVRLIVRGHFRMGLFVLLSLTTYCRPGGLFLMKKCDLIPPWPRAFSVGRWCYFPRNGGGRRRVASSTTRFRSTTQISGSWTAFGAHWQGRETRPRCGTSRPATST